MWGRNDPTVALVRKRAGQRLRDRAISEPISLALSLRTRGCLQSRAQPSAFWSHPVNRKSAAKAAPKNPVGKIVDRAFGVVSRALATSDSATNLLIRQHADVKALFAAIEE